MVNTFVYSPSIEVHIQTINGDIIDVTEDVTRASLTQRSSGISSFNVELQNPVRKYDNLFTPMDKCVVYMTRVKRMLQFSGYLDTVPIFSAFPGSVALSASSTLKRLQNFLWDSGTEVSRGLLRGNKDNYKTLDGGVAAMATEILTKVVGWPLDSIHIGIVPPAWFDFVSGLSDRLSAEAQANEVTAKVMIGSGTIAGGSVITGSKDAEGNAKVIVQTVQQANLPKRAAVIAVACAMDESSLIVVNHGDIAGPDSRGLFQQRDSWGSLADRMDPQKSTQLFLNAMIKIPNWQTRSVTDVCHSVQINQDPNTYAKFEAPAQAYADKYWNNGGVAPATAGANPQGGAGVLAGVGNSTGSTVPNAPVPNGVPPPAPGEDPWVSMQKQFLAAFPDGRVTSAVRPGDPGHHGVGQAIDCAGPDLQKIADWWFKAYPLLAQEIYINGPFQYHEEGNPRAHGSINVDNADQSQLKNQIYRDDYANHCVPLDVRILTRRGWLTYDQLQVGDETPGFNFNSQQTEWTRVTKINLYDEAEVVESASNKWSVRSTRNHKWISRNSVTSRYAWDTTDSGRQPPWRVSAPMMDGPGLDLTDDESELLGWLLTDGSQWEGAVKCSFPECDLPARAMTLCGSHRRQQLKGIVLHALQKRPGCTPGIDLYAWQTKPIGVTRLAELLGDKATWNGKGYRLRSNYARDLLGRAGISHIKNADQILCMLAEMTGSQRLAMLAGVIGGDGTNGGQRIYQDDGPLIDVISTLAHFCGHRVNVTKRDVGTTGYPNCNGVHMTVSLARPFVSTYKQGRRSLGHMPVWCPTTELGSWTAQFDHNPVLTGNSDHVHVASLTPLGPPGSAGPGGSSAGSAGGGAGGTAASTSVTPDQVGAAIFNVFQWLGKGGPVSQFSSGLYGIRALMNDQPILPDIITILEAGLREFTAAPNGDFIAWFPDYFGQWGTAAKMVIEDIELQEGFTVAWSDSFLKTHIFVTSTTNASPKIGLDPTSFTRAATTAGIASVEYPELMKALFKVPPAKFDFTDGAVKFLSRYGARASWKPMNNINSAGDAYGHRIEFFFAVQTFMRNWAEQFQATVSITFMPEVFPGMLLCFPSYGVQGYVQEVTHTYDSTNGFETSPSCIAWSNIGTSSKNPSQGGIDGLPIGGPL